MDDIVVSEQLKAKYAGYYEGESFWRSLGAAAKADNIVRLCKTVRHDRILEIGSGEGSVLQWLSDLNFGTDLYSIEISESAVATINGRSIPRVRECRLFDGYRIQYENRHFDLAVLSHVLEHVEYPRRLLYEASRVAHHVFIEVPLEDTLRLKNDFISNEVGHINFYSRKAIRRLVQTCDLRVLSQVVTNAPLSAYKYQFGRLGLMKYTIKEVLLRLCPPLAGSLFTYHSALLCSRAQVRDNQAGECTFGWRL
jgi:SAM-dependent methyltransferase